MVGGETIDVVVPLEEEAQALHPVVPLSTNLKDKGLDVRSDPIRAEPGTSPELAEPGRSVLAVPAIPEVEPAARDPEEPTGGSRSG